ncbi:hypothetical protein OAL44_03400 [Planctomycetaceae bacterium]|nr:hypothetical protein [Planctomycetaceae bacterium]
MSSPVAHESGSDLTTLPPQSTSNSPRAPPTAQQPLPTALREFVLVPDGELLEAQSGETQAEDFREFQLVLDPEFL